jgi:hypothetical protein
VLSICEVVCFRNHARDSGYIKHMYKLYYRYQLALIVSDFLVTLLTLLAEANLRPFLPGQEIAASLVIRHRSIYLVTPLSLLIVFGFSGVYNFRQRPRLSVQMRSFVLSHTSSRFIK